MTMKRRRFLVGMGQAGIVGIAALAPSRARAATGPIAAFVEFETAPFPYNGVVPSTGRPFLDVEKAGRLGHASPRGGVYWQDTTYSDDRVLLAFSQGFRADRPGLMVVYFHGNDATLDKDVLGRQRVLAQFEAAGINGVLVAPQFAVDAFDSSAGKFWEPGGFGRFLSEAAARLAPFVAPVDGTFTRMPVVLIAYSGGYEAAAYALTEGGTASRTSGVVLLDAIYGEQDRFADFVRRHRSSFFVSAYTDAAEAGNETLRNRLDRFGIPVAGRPPTNLSPGTVSIFPSPGEHDDFVTMAWVPDPITAILRTLS